MTDFQIERNSNGKYVSGRQTMQKLMAPRYAGN